MKYSSQNTATFANLYKINECLRPYCDVANSNHGKCDKTLAMKIIDCDKVFQKSGRKSVDVVFATGKSIVFTEMKMGVTAKGTAPKEADQIKEKIINSCSVLSGQGTFNKYEYAYVLLSNNSKNFNQLKSIFLKVLRPSRKCIGAIEVLKESEFEKEFFRD